MLGWHTHITYASVITLAEVFTKTRQKEAEIGCPMGGEAHVESRRATDKEGRRYRGLNLLTRSERIIYAITATYVCCLLGLHVLYYTGIFSSIERDPSAMIHATRTTFVCLFMSVISIQIARQKPFGLLIVAAVAYSSATFIEDFLVSESSFFLPEHPLAGALFTLRPLFLLMVLYWAVQRRSIETS